MCIRDRAGHGHDIAADAHHKARAGSQADLTHLHGKARRSRQQLGVVAEAVLRLGDWKALLLISSKQTD